MIDCLGEKDLQTGRNRLEDASDSLQKLNPACFDESKKFIKGFSACNVQEFSAVIEEIVSLTAQGIRPILFIDGHGHPVKGLRLPSDEYLSWQVVIQLCRVLLQMCAGELSVIVAACHSMAVISLLDANARLPFAFYYGYPNSVPAGVIADETRLVCNSLLFDGGRSVMEAKLKLTRYSEYEHVHGLLAMALLISTAPRTSAELMPELSRAKLRRSFEEDAISRGVRLAGMSRHINATLNSGEVAISLVRMLMHDTERRDRVIEDISQHIEFSRQSIRPV